MIKSHDLESWLWGLGGRGGISGDVPSGACAPAVADVGMLETASFAILDDFGQ